MNDVASLIEGPAAINAAGWYLASGCVLFAVGMVRAFLAPARLTRIISLNVMGFGALILLVTVGARGGSPDPVLTALAITGLVITVAFTGVAVALARALDLPDPDNASETAPETHAAPEPGPAEGEVDDHVRR